VGGAQRNPPNMVLLNGSENRFLPYDSKENL